MASGESRWNSEEEMDTVEVEARISKFASRMRVELEQLQSASLLPRPRPELVKLPKLPKPAKPTSDPPQPAPQPSEVQAAAAAPDTSRTEHPLEAVITGGLAQLQLSLQRFLPSAAEGSDSVPKLPVLQRGPTDWPMMRISALANASGRKQQKGAESGSGSGLSTTVYQSGRPLKRKRKSPGASLGGKGAGPGAAAAPVPSTTGRKRRGTLAAQPVAKSTRKKRAVGSALVAQRQAETESRINDRYHNDRRLAAFLSCTDQMRQENIRLLREKRGYVHGTPPVLPSLTWLPKVDRSWVAAFPEDFESYRQRTSFSWREILETVKRLGREGLTAVRLEQVAGCQLIPG